MNQTLSPRATRLIRWIEENEFESINLLTTVSDPGRLVESITLTITTTGRYATRIAELYVNDIVNDIKYDDVWRLTALDPVYEHQIKELAAMIEMEFGVNVETIWPQPPDFSISWTWGIIIVVFALAVVGILLYSSMTLPNPPNVIP